MTQSAVRCHALVKRYGDKTAVAGIELTIEEGECFGLLGPNGAGKTTTVEMLEGLHQPDSGSLELFGMSFGRGHDHALRQRFGVQLQQTELADKLTVTEVLRLFRSFYDTGYDVSTLVELTGLGEFQSQRFQTLSGGQKQRVALACALVGAPELLFLDEPTTGLDPRARKGMWSVVEHFRDQGGTILITTHYMEEAAALCDRIAIMDRGKIIAEGTPRALVDSLGFVQFVEFESHSEVNQTALLALGPVESVEQRGQRFRLRIARELSALSAVLAELERQGVVPMGLSTHQATLDDVFLELTGRDLSSAELEAARGQHEAGTEDAPNPEASVKE